MNRAELIDVLARKLGTDHRYATAVLDNFLDTIVRAVHRGDSVTITGFGVFKQRRRGTRVARNPRTGETVKVKPTSVPSFRPGAQFKAVVSGAEHLQPEEPAAKPGGGVGDADEAAAPTSTFAGASAAASVAVVTVDTVHPVQALIAESTEVQKAVSGPVIQKEARLTERFQQYLEGHDHKVMRYRITPAGTPTRYSDLADIAENTFAFGLCARCEFA